MRMQTYASARFESYQPYAFNRAAGVNINQFMGIGCASAASDGFSYVRDDFLNVFNHYSSVAIATNLSLIKAETIPLKYYFSALYPFESVCSNEVHLSELKSFY